MKRILAGAAGVAFLGIAVFVAGPMRTEARDYGQTGQAFPVIEPDLLATIEGRLKRAEASGELARTNQMFAKRVEAKVRRPTPVAGITPAIAAREWDYDPAVRLERDIHDQKGNLIASAGQSINPLDFVAVKQSLVFIDGDDAAQIAWATSRFTDLNAKIIFVSGSPLEEMTNRKRRFFFDQAGKLTSRFGIEHTPAVVRQTGRVMRVTEQVLRPGKGKLMPLWLDLLRTPMAAPETPSLRRLRLTWQALCLSSALVVGLFRPFHRAVGRLAPLTAALVLIVTVAWTAFYLVRKHRADTAFLDLSGSAE